MQPSPLVLHVIPETFDYDISQVGRITWNVTLAKQLIARRDQGLVIIERVEMQAIADWSAFDEAHIRDVNPQVPGIGAPILWEGRIIFVLIDGIHRNVRALREGLSFQARLLTDEDARRCVISAPPGVISQVQELLSAASPLVCHRCH